MAIAEAFTADTGGIACLDTLLQSHSRWTAGSVSFAFRSGPGAIVGVESAATATPFASVGSWSSQERTAILNALAQISSVCAVTLIETTNTTAANIGLWRVPAAALPAQVQGTATLPGALQLGQGFGAAAWFNADPIGAWSHIQPGGYGYTAILHYLGRTLGLSDFTPSSGNAVAALTCSMMYDTGVAAIGGTAQDLTAEANYGHLLTPMASDIAALQLLYGPNLSTRTGNDTYTLPDTNDRGTGWSCIWDAGGNDTISNYGSSTGCTIDLRAATLTGTAPGGMASAADGIAGGFTIAKGVVVENAVGGSGNDTLTGNAADNRLDGGQGADTMTGGAGNDNYSIDNRADAVVELAGEGIDTIRSCVKLTLPGNVENLVLTQFASIDGTGNALDNVITGNLAANALLGCAGADTLFGGAGNDMLDGGAGQDVLSGGTGADIFRIRTLVDSKAGAATRDRIVDFSADDGDRIDLIGIDANGKLAGVQHFTFIADAALTAPGQLHVEFGIDAAGKPVTILAGEVNGSPGADFAVELMGHIAIDVDSLLLA